MSSIQIRNKGPNLDPCGTPQVISNKLDFFDFRVQRLVSAFLAKMQTEDWNEVRSCMIPLVSGVASIATSRNRNGGEWWRKVKGFS